MFLFEGFESLESIEHNPPLSNPHQQGVRENPMSSLYSRLSSLYSRLSSLHSTLFTLYSIWNGPKATRSRYIPFTKPVNLRTKKPQNQPKPIAVSVKNTEKQLKLFMFCVQFVHAIFHFTRPDTQYRLRYIPLSVGTVVWGFHNRRSGSGSHQR